MASLARERALCDGERTELRSGSDPPYAIKRRGKHGKSKDNACHRRIAEYKQPDDAGKEEQIEHPVPFYLYP